MQAPLSARITGLASEATDTTTINFVRDMGACYLRNEGPASILIKFNGTPGVFSTTFRARAANIVTLTTSSAHGFVTGDKINVVLLADDTFNGTYTLLSGSGTTLTYANTGANVGSTADTLGRISNVKNQIRMLSRESINISQIIYKTVGVYCYNDDTNASVDCIATVVEQGQV